MMKVTKFVGEILVGKVSRQTEYYLRIQDRKAKTQGSGETRFAWYFGILVFWYFLRLILL